MQPVQIRSVASVALIVHDAWLSCCGPLLCHAAVTVRSGQSATEYAAAGPAAFTDSPHWEAPLSFEVRDPRDRIFLEVTDSLTGAFLGRTPLALGLGQSNRSLGKTKWMLLPRGVGDGCDATTATAADGGCGGGGDDKCANGEANDLATLARYHQDDFGYIVVQWDVRLNPIGPPCLRDVTVRPAWATTGCEASLSAGGTADGDGDGGSGGQREAAPTNVIVSCAVSATWLCGPVPGAAAPTAALSSLTVRFGGDSAAEVITLSSGVPQHVALHSCAGTAVARTVRFSVWGHNTADGAPAVVGDASLSLPNVLDTECSALLPLRPVIPAASPSPGYLAVRILVSTQALPGYRSGSGAGSSAAAPLSSTGGVNNYCGGGDGTAGVGAGRAAPDVETSLLAAPFWETHEHVARATERRWRRGVAIDAMPQREHVRHLFDVISGTAVLHSALLPVVTAFFNLPTDIDAAAAAAAAPPTISCDLRPLLIAMCFASAALTPREAALFAFEALTSSAAAAAPSASAVDVVSFILECCLLPNTLDLTASDVRRRATNIVSSYAIKSFTVHSFDNAFAQNASLWISCGCTLAGVAAIPRDGTGASVASQQWRCSRSADRSALTLLSPGGESGANSAVTASHTVAPPGDSGDAGVWRHFVVSSMKTKKKFAVTAHESDTFTRVADQVKLEVGIPPAKQRMRLHGQAALEMSLEVGRVIQWSPQPVQEVEVDEVTDDVTLIVVWREKGRKWSHSMPGKEKVLRLRAYVQQQTRIPLSRIVLSIGKTVLWDRHAMTHYGVADGTVIEVKTQ